MGEKNGEGEGMGENKSENKGEGLERVLERAKERAKEMPRVKLYEIARTWERAREREYKGGCGAEQNLMVVTSKLVERVMK